MLSSLRMGMRLVTRTRLLAGWLTAMVLMSLTSRAVHNLSPEQRAAHWILAVATLPIFATSLFAREYLALPLSFFVVGTRRRLFRAQVGLCVLTGFAIILGMRATNSVTWASAGSFGAFGLAWGALICVVTLRFARWGVAVWLLLVQWPLFGTRWISESWVREQTWFALMVAAACLLYLGRRLDSARLHRSLCGQNVVQLADWWDPSRLERMKARQENAQLLASTRRGARLLTGILDRAHAALRRGDRGSTRAWQLTWAVVSRSLPQSRRTWSPVAMLVLTLLVLPYLDSIHDDHGTVMRGWFAGWVIAPAIYCADGIVRLVRRNAILESRIARERAGLRVGAGTLIVAGLLGAACWAVGRALAQVVPDLPIGGRVWTYHAPAPHVAFLAAAIVPSQLLAVAALRRPHTRWPNGLGFQLLLLMHFLMLGVRHAVSGPIVAAFALACAAAFVAVWCRRCRRSDIVE